MKHLLKLALTLGMIGCMSVTALAAESLPAPAEVKWGSIPGQATWKIDPLAQGNYMVEYYKDDKPFKTTQWQGNTTGVDNFQYHIVDSGTYKFKVKALGDSINYGDSRFSSFSPPYTYTDPGVSMEKVTNVAWSDTEPYVATWDAPKNLGANAKYLSYRVRLYENTVEIFSKWGITDTEIDLSSEINHENTYIFSVEALSSNIEAVGHGPKVYSAAYEDVTENNESLKDYLDDLNLTTPSDALSQIKSERTISELAVGMQSNPDILNKIADLEKNYLQELNKKVDIDVESQTGVDAAAIQLIGAGLNIKDSSDSVTFHVKKPTKESAVDSSLYGNTLQVNLSLAGAETTLKIPITITMPIPSNISPDRLNILHQKKDGTFELLNAQVDHSNGTVSFTVTSFSLFIFAEGKEDDSEVTDPDEDDGDLPDEDNGDSGDSGTGGSGSGDSGSGGSGSGGSGSGGSGSGGSGSGGSGSSGSGGSGSSGGSGGGSGSGGSGSRLPSSQTGSDNTKGSWAATEKGWQFKDTSGNPITNSWIRYNNLWYFMDMNGIMSTKWILWNNNWYYLTPGGNQSEGGMKTGWVYDGDYQNWFYMNSQGILMDGWQQIEGKWYYLNPSSDGTKGAMVTDKVIDGYTLGSDGVRKE